MATDVHRAPCAAAAILCIAALGHWPYGYYTVLRWVVTLTAILLAIHGYSSVRRLEDDRERQWWSLAVVPGLIGLAILFNPLVPFAMQRNRWGVFDLLAGVVLVVGTFVSFDLRRVPTADVGYSMPDSWEPTQAGNRVLPQTLGKWIVGSALLAVLITFATASEAPGGDPDCVSIAPGDC